MIFLVDAIEDPVIRAESDDRLPAAEEDVRPPTVEAELAAVRTELAGLSAAVRHIQANLRAIDEYRVLRAKDAHLIDMLHAENTELRNDQLTTAMRPLFNGLIKLYDLMGPPTAADKQTKLLINQLLQILELNGVEVYEPVAGTAFDSTRQNGTVVTDINEAQADSKVARTLRPGFLRADVVIRPAAVEVYRFQPAD